MKQHFFTHGGLLLAFMAILTFAACERDLQINPTSAVEKLVTPDDNIQAAKDWFESTQIPISSKFKGMKPDWSKAITTNSEVEVPFAIEDRITIPSLYPNFAHLGKERLTIYIRQDGQKEAFITNLMPFESFRGSMKIVNSTNFQEMHFDGLISVCNLLGEDMTVYHYEQGNFIKQLKIHQSLKDNNCEWSRYQYVCTWQHYNSSNEPECGNAEQTDCYGE